MEELSTLKIMEQSSQVKDICFNVKLELAVKISYNTIDKFINKDIKEKVWIRMIYCHML